MRFIEDIMFQISDFFMAPVLILLVVLFGYSLYALGVFFATTIQRRLEKSHFVMATSTQLGSPSFNQNKSKQAMSLKGYSLVALAHAKPTITRDELDVAALEELEGVRTVSRLAPMLGLIATMIPMGPALKSLADGNVQGISENLIVAFSAVIFGLIIASITFWIASVKKRWLAHELIAITPLLESVTRGKEAVVEAVHEAA